MNRETLLKMSTVRINKLINLALDVLDKRYEKKYAAATSGKKASKKKHA